MSRINIGKVAPIPKGDWVQSQPYEKLNMVSKSGVLYIAKQDVPADTAITNTDYWMQATGEIEIGNVETVSTSTGASVTTTTSINGNTILNFKIPRGESGNETIDDSKGEGDTDYVWSADKTFSEINNIKNERATAITETASGSIVNFTDGANSTVEDLKINIEPVQDLHGYANPWPAGGGKNLIPLTVDAIKAENTSGTWSDNRYTHNGVQFELYVDNGGNVFGVNVKGTTTSSTTGSFLKLPITALHAYDDQSLIMTNGINAVNNFRMWMGTESYETVASIRSGSLTFTMSSTATRLWLQVQEGSITNLRVFPMIRLATVADATFEPYTNICPISGWTNADIFDDPIYGGTVKWNQQLNLTTSKTGTANGITFVENGDGTITANGTPTDATAGTTYIYTANNDFSLVNGHIYTTGIKNPINTWWLGFDSSSVSLQFRYYGVYKINNLSSVGGYKYIRTDKGYAFDNVTITPQIFDLTEIFGQEKAEEILAMENATPGSGVAYFRSLFPKAYYLYNNTFAKTCVSAVNGNPYRHITIDLDGTRYGGTLNVLTGTMAVTKFGFDATSDLTYGVSSQGTNCNVFQIALSLNDLPSSVAYTAKSNRFSGMIPSDTPGRMVHSGNTIYFVISKSEVEYTVASLKTWLDNHPTQFVYTLATPLTVQLSPSQISTLLGQNNLWADTGDTEVTYRADTKLYIQKLTQPTEDDMIANNNIEANKFFMLGNSLYYSTTAIAIGTSIIPGNNCTKLSLADALNNLNS